MSEPARKATFTQRRAIGFAGALAGVVLLGACSTDTGLSTPAYVRPSPPTQAAIVAAANALATNAKLAGPREISAARPSDHGPGSYVVCLREASPPSGTHPRYYALFFDNDESKGARLSVILDACERQTFSPLPPAPASPPASRSNAAGPQAGAGVQR